MCYCKINCAFAAFFVQKSAGRQLGGGAGEGAVADALVSVDVFLNGAAPGAGGLGLGERLGRISVCFQSDFSVVQMGFVHKCERKKHSLFRWSDGAV